MIRPCILSYMIFPDEIQQYEWQNVRKFLSPEACVNMDSESRMSSMNHILFFPNLFGIERFKYYISIILIHFYLGLWKREKKLCFTISNRIWNIFQWRSTIKSRFLNQNANMSTLPPPSFVVWRREMEALMEYGIPIHCQFVYSWSVPWKFLAVFRLLIEVKE